MNLAQPFMKKRKKTKRKTSEVHIKEPSKQNTRSQEQEVIKIKATKTKEGNPLLY
eukprot:GDKH01002985.1.p2 GENE.GDKH01002985.1~~GDKH01002985.1.p2  ORF type:complete len:55 (-),score=7.08 GDKH01002985.1:136-300(-)